MEDVKIGEFNFDATGIINDLEMCVCVYVLVFIFLHQIETTKISRNEEKQKKTKKAQKLVLFHLTLIH